MIFPSSRKLITASYALAVFLIMVVNGNLGSLEWWAFSAIFLLWAVFPIAALCLISRQNRIFPVAAAVLGIVGIVIYVDAMFGENVRSTAGLIFLFLPVWQNLAVLVFAAIFFSLRAIGAIFHDR